MLKRYRNAPAHLLLDDTPYFITGAIYDKRPLLAGPGLKERFTELLHRGFERYGWRLDDWVGLDNHYHLLGQSRLGADLPRLLKYLHGQSARWLHEATDCPLPVWWNYFIVPTLQRAGTRPGPLERPGLHSCPLGPGSDNTIANDRGPDETIIYIGILDG